MKPEDISRIEGTLGVTLPAAYRVVLVSALDQGITDMPELCVSADELIAMNGHFTMDPHDLSALRGTGLLDRLKFFLFYKSPRVLVQSRIQYQAEWVGGARFVIGSDLGEEVYFIRLGDDAAAVQRHDLETGETVTVAERAGAWLAAVRRMRDEAQD